MKILNNNSYRNVENLNNFTKVSFKKYCINKLNSCDQNIKFFKKKKIIQNSKRYAVCEIGTGNGKLLYSLEKKNFINQALGFEVSKSRVKFAKRFGKFIKSKQVKIVNKDFFKNKIHKNTFDLIIGVDIVFNLISANFKNADKKLLKECSRLLKRGGHLVLEVMSFKDELKILNKKKKLTKTTFFKSNDPFFKCLTNYEHRRDLIYLKKKFYKRNGSISYFENLVKPLAKDYWKKLKKWNLNIYNYWVKVNDTREKEYIVVLTKK
jgi:SAM-dependent methyltransferase